MAGGGLDFGGVEKNKVKQARTHLTADWFEMRMEFFLSHLGGGEK